MTYLELCEKLRTRTGTGGGTLTDVVNLTGALQRLTQYVQDAWLEIQTDKEWNFRWAEFSETLTAGSQVYDLAAAIGGGEIVIDVAPITIEKSSDSTTRKRLRSLNFSYFQHQFAHMLPKSGTPNYITIEPDGENVKFETTLDVDYILKGQYRVEPQTLTDKTDVPILPASYHMAIFYRALMKWAEFEEADAVYVTASKADMGWQTQLTNDFIPKILVGSPPMA